MDQTAQTTDSPINGAPDIASQVTPAGCGCSGGTRETVFVIGDRLWYDFGTLIRQSSIEDNFNGPVRTPEDLLKYLLGYKRSDPPGKINGNLFDADSVYWILYQGDCPKYAIRPEGPFSAAIYKAVLTFFIENNDLANSDFLDHCLQDFFECHGGLMKPFRSPDQAKPGPPASPSGSVSAYGAHPKGETGHEAKTGPEHPLPPSPPSESTRSFDPGVETALFFGESPTKASHLAFPGKITGKFRLLSGEMVDVINPNLRGMASWNTLNLVEVVKQFLPGKDATTFITRIASRLYEESRNDGRKPEDRAKNWAATHLIRSFTPIIQSQIFRDFLGMNSDQGKFVSAAVNDVVVKPAECIRTGMEYDVEISLYDTENFLRGLTVLTTTVDVSDDVPVTTTKFRISTRRS